MGEHHRHRARSRLRGLTLVEVLIATLLLLVAIAVIGGAVIFFSSNIAASSEQQNMSLQIDTAFEDMRVYCLSAVSVSTPFSSGGSTRNRLTFTGESDPFIITPDDLSDNATHSYYVNNAGDLVHEVNGVVSDVLVERRFQPTLEFRYTSGNEPNYLTVTVTATSQRAPLAGSNPIQKTDSLLFWFASAVS